MAEKGIKGNAIALENFFGYLIAPRGTLGTLPGTLGTLAGTLGTLSKPLGLHQGPLELPG